MASVKRHSLQVSEASTLFSGFSALCRSPSKASCCARTRVDHGYPHGLRMSEKHFGFGVHCLGSKV